MYAQVIRWGKLVKFSHSIFALPFALSIFAYLASRATATGTQLLWVVAALVAARTAAMTFNRIVDRQIDAKNPRTKEREIPSGSVSLSSAWGLFLISALIFHLSAGMLGLHCLVLAPLVLAVLMIYSCTKRFTAAAHLVLGLSLAMAPGGVWYALTGSVAWIPVPLMLGVLCWVAGFDILYSCQDIDFDRSEKLHSIPARFGISRALQFSRALHVMTFIFLGLFGYVAGLGNIYFLGLLVFGLVLASQHRLVRPDDLSRVDAAFFARNGIASVIYFVAVLADRLFGSV